MLIVLPVRGGDITWPEAIGVVAALIVAGWLFKRMTRPTPPDDPPPT